jgi:MFS family permease
MDDNPFIRHFLRDGNKKFPFCMTELSDSPTDDVITSSRPGETLPTYRAAFFIASPVFMAYACCFSLQKHLATQFGLYEGISGSHLSRVYGIGVSFVFFFNLLFRVGHNLVFGCLSPRNRIVVALCSVSVGMSILFFVSVLPVPPYFDVPWVFVAYAFVGVGNGTFSPNILNIVHPLGETRRWVVLAMPSGVASITIFGFALIGLGVPYQFFYAAVALAAVTSILVYLRTIYPIATSESVTFDLKQFCADLFNIRHWFPGIWRYALAFMINMMFLSLFGPGCTLYVYQRRVSYRLLGTTIGHSWFMFIYNCGSFLGDFVSRRVMDQKKIVHPALHIGVALFALVLNLALIPEIAPLAAFGFSWTNGTLYTQSTRLIGELFPERYHLTATSVWLFTGDLGSTAGSNLVQVLVPVIVAVKSIMY